jgi:mono/diheme cytochrome c family protein
MLRTLRSVGLLFAALVAVAATTGPFPAGSAAAQQPIDAEHAAKMAQGLEVFKRHVRPLLVEHCLKCHGGEKTENGLDLATREGLLRGGKSGPAIVRHDAKQSRLYRLVSHTAEPHMPRGAGKLPDAAVQHIGSWIDLGAPYDRPIAERAAEPAGKPVVSDRARQFWSFQPLRRPPIPRVVNPIAAAADPLDCGVEWCRTPVDQFIQSTLAERGLAPNRVADRRTLIRRLYLDVLGIPPAPDDVEAFVQDPARDAYDRLVDRVMASPHYGERWGRHWLDLARFAESHGYEQDYDRPAAYHYRDFVIRALNLDMPYDQFVRWQIAGDEYEPDNPLAMMATGYLGAGTHATQITANQAEKERYDELDDMAATIGTSLLGLTLGCARCHDHKYDPIPTHDYYRLVSTFTTTVRSDLELDLHPERYRAAKAEFDRRHAPLADALARFEHEQLPGRLDQWLAAGGKAPSPRWLVLDFESVKSAGGATLTKQDDGSVLASGTNSASDTYELVARTPLRGITALRIEALAHASLPKNGPGRAANGNFALSDLRVTATPVTPPAAKPLDVPQVPVELRLVHPKATFEQPGLPVAATIDGDRKSAWAVDPQFGKDHAAVFELDAPAGFETGTVLTFSLRFENNTGHQIGRPRIAISTATGPVSLDGEQDRHDRVVEVERILATPAPLRTDPQKAALLAWYRTIDPEWQKLNGAVQSSLKQAPKPELTKVMVTSEGVPAIRLHTQGPDFYEKTYFLKRGDLAQKQAEASQSFLQILMRAPEEEKRWQLAPPADKRTSYRRRALAEWLTDVEFGAGNLLARVIVNRIWQHHFGRGIVATPSDFGAQGERPSHPELLDWLACELIAGGWRLKTVHRLILTSAAYMQGGQFHTAAAKADPDNTLCWRRAPRRIEAEAIRDAMLALTGSLDRRMFGPGSLDEAQARRSIYFFVKRSQLIPLMMLFDAPDSLTSLAQRAETIVAPQALALMNNAQVRRYATAFAERLRREAGSAPAAAVVLAYRLALSRPPTADELADSVSFLLQQTESYRASGKSNAAELALADFCQAVLGLNEFMYVE